MFGFLIRLRDVGTLLFASNTRSVQSVERQNKMPKSLDSYFKHLTEVGNAANKAPWIWSDEHLFNNEETPYCALIHRDPKDEYDDCEVISSCDGCRNLWDKDNCEALNIAPQLNRSRGYPIPAEWTDLLMEIKKAIAECEALVKERG